MVPLNAIARSLLALLVLLGAPLSSCSEESAGERNGAFDRTAPAPRLGDFVPALRSMVLVRAVPGQSVALTSTWSESVRGSFYCDEFEVTHREFAAFLRETGNRPVSDALEALWNGPEPPETIADHPVTCVTAADAEAFARHAGKRLPTLAEWHRAALRQNGEFPWTGPFHRNKCNSIELNLGGTTVVGTFESGKSAWGAYDVFGNVWEWTSTTTTISDPWRRGRAVVGGAFDSWVRPRSRSLPWLDVEQPGNWSRSLGFRCVRDIDEPLVRSVIDAARRGPPAVRREAVQHLRAYSDDLAVPALEAVAIEDPDASVREIAVKALIGQGAPPAVSSRALRRILGENIDPMLRAEAAAELATRGEEAGVAALRDALSSSRAPEVRQFAFASLAALDPKGDGETLAEFVRAERDEHVKVAMVSALVEGLDPSSPSFAPVLESIAADPSAEIRSRFVQSLGGRDAPGVAADLVARMAKTDPDPEVRIEAIRALDSDAASLEELTVAGLAVPSAEEDPSVRAALAEEAVALRERLAAPRLLESLRAALRSDPSESVRAAIVRTLGQARREGLEAGGAVLDSIESAAVGDESADVRDEALRVLAAIGAKESFERLAERLRSGGESEDSVRAALVEAVARCGGEAAEPFVSARLADPSRPVARAAERALVVCGAIGLEKADAAAAAALAADPNDFDALLQKARIAARAGNSEEARSYILRVETMLNGAANERTLDDYRIADDPGYRIEDDPLLGPLVYRKAGE